jgi:hypothetical protein
LYPGLFTRTFPCPAGTGSPLWGPYNEHLVSDYGAMNLAMGVLLVAAAVFLERRLLLVSLVAWLAYAMPHFVFHLGQVHHFSPFDNLMQLGALGFVVLLPLVLFLRMWPSN